MSIQNMALNALFRAAQAAAMRLEPQQRFLRNRKLLAVDRSRVKKTIQVRPDILAGVKVEWITHERNANQSHLPICVYFHGGGFVAGSLHSHRDMAAMLCDKANVTVLMVDYRLAPEHRFPAGLDDALTVYRGLLSQGVSANRLCLAGDSAGGNITLATAQAIRDAQLPAPKALVLFSPWLDLQNNSPSCSSNAHHDAMLNTQILDEFALLYASDLPLDHPRMSPLRGEVTGLPPCLIIASKVEVLRDDARQLYEKITTQGGRAELLEWDKPPHAFPVMARFLPEGRDALKATATFIQKHLT
jgi:acetyl esterase/lipase